MGMWLLTQAGIKSYAKKNREKYPTSNTEWIISDVTLKSWRHKSPVIRMFVQQFVSTKKIKVFTLQSFCEGNPPVTGGLPLTKSSK